VSAVERARWGWHELTDRAASRLVTGAQLRPGTLVLDLGAGRGAITHRLIASGARVIAVELHPTRAEELRRRFAGSSVTVVRADVSDLRLPRRPFRVVANPPFAAVTAVLRRLVAPGSRLVRADLVVPAYVARRWTSLAAPGRERWRWTFDIHVSGRVRAHDFRPPAPRDAHVLVIERR
jgi:23S rRNA (adenine-N6)-dimethyltransferase